MATEELLAQIRGCVENLKHDDVSTIATGAFRSKLINTLIGAKDAIESAKVADHTRFGVMFLREADTPRVVTVGWFREQKAQGTRLHLAFAVNRVERESVAYACDGFVPRWTIYDYFDKDVGKDKVKLRLLTAPNEHMIDLEDGEKTKAAILRYVRLESHRVPSPIARVIRRSLAPAPVAAPASA